MVKTMTIKTTTTLIAVAASLLISSQAFAFTGPRPPPTGLNGPSVNGLDKSWTGDTKQDETGIHSSELKSVTLPDGSQIDVR